MGNNYAPLASLIAGAAVAIWLFQTNRNWGRPFLSAKKTSAKQPAQGSLISLQLASMLFVIVAAASALVLYATFRSIVWLVDTFV